MTMGEQWSSFRESVRGWINVNFPPALAGKSIAIEGARGSESMDQSPDFELWVERLAAQGWGVPTWPVAYGGAGLDKAQGEILQQELALASASNPVPMITGMGALMVGPTLLDFGTEEQKSRHLPGIASGKVRWCLGLSEPNAGSDLASLSAKAEDRGDHYVINGQKVWTSGANLSQWCAALVRTGSGSNKRDGLSVMMLPMDQSGVETRPIQLISGASPFCETYFNNAKVDKGDVLGEIDNGWQVIKRLLQYERQSQSGPLGFSKATPPPPLDELAKAYVGIDGNGKLADPDLRMRIAQQLMDTQAHELTVTRVAAEVKANGGVSDAVSILKNSATAVGQMKAELTLEILGSQGVGWEGAAYQDHELTAVKEWLLGKATSIYGGSTEIQNNIISKNILGLPEMTQKD